LTTDSPGHTTELPPLKQPANERVVWERHGTWVGRSCSLAHEVSRRTGMMITCVHCRKPAINRCTRRWCLSDRNGPMMNTGVSAAVTIIIGTVKTAAIRQELTRSAAPDDRGNGIGLNLVSDELAWSLVTHLLAHVGEHRRPRS